mgnify:CR=1 FL=1
MIQKLRNNQLVKATSVFLIQVFVFELFLIPTPVYGQAGPNQTETAGFTLGSTSSLVDEFTGDFSYSIPLLDVDGYPITISYNSNVSMFQEASWVGLGWDLNVGSVSRDMRGIPDDFNGTDEVIREIGMKDYETDGNKGGLLLGGGVGFGENPGGGSKGGAGISLSLLYGTYMNSYNGKGTTWDFGFGGNVNLGDKLSFNSGVGFSSDSQNGVGRNNSIGVGANAFKHGLQFGGGFTASSQFSSRAGLKSTHFNMSHSITTSKYNKKFQQGGGVSFSHGSTYSLGTITSVPRYDLPRYGENVTNTFTGTGVLRFTLVELRVGGLFSDYYFNDLAIDNKEEIKSPAYGYFHLGKGQNASASSRSIMDFNRERDSEFSEEMVILPFSAPTYDFFNVSAMGISGSIRGQRTDVGTLQDPIVTVANEGVNRSVEVIAGYAPPTGVILGFSYAQGNVTGAGLSGHWFHAGESTFKWSPNEVDGFEEGVFFKAIGEPTPKNMNQWNSFKGLEPIRMNLNKSSDGNAIESSGTFSSFNEKKKITNLAINASTFVKKDNSTPVRATYYKPYTGDAYSQLHPLFDKVYFQAENDWITPTINDEPRINSMRKGHHISAMEAVSIDGLRYYFDVPVYNHFQSDVVFNAAGLSGTQDFATTTNSGNVSYSSGDNSVNNDRGRNGFFEKTTTPGYAHSYLLSYLVSSDYVDRTYDGPTEDDYGDYYKFNYTRIYSESNPYKWRFPYESNSAKLIEGHRSTPFDDVATYTYGEKDIWYTKSIETKNYIVEFHLNDNTTDKRKDGHGVNGENGGLNAAMSLRKLDKIVLYNRNDRLENGVNAVPLKVVTFTYDYSLCKGNPSTHSPGNYAESGKLTLKSIHFSGADSEMGMLAPYEFVYDRGGSHANDNPDFSYINIDRWGNFKQNTSTYNNIEYPYAVQNEADANSYIQAWKLKSIRTPSNGGIAVDYEADRFAYTQDKSVMRLIRVLGMTTMDDFKDNGFANATQTFHMPSDKEEPHLVLFFELDEPITGTTQQKKEKIKEMYFQNAEKDELISNDLFFQFRVKINPAFENSYENIYGFLDIFQNYGVVEHGGTQMGYVYIQSVDIKDKDGKSSYKVNPIQKAAWQYARLNIPDVVYGNCNFNWSNPTIGNCDYSNKIDAAVAFGKDLNKQLNKRGYCEYFDATHSFIRLYDPRGYKFGGNARVKSITYTDNWNEMVSNEATASYTWEYSYDDVRTGMTSGVAAYEPALGNVVNPFYKWTAYKNTIKQFPDESRFAVEPIGELLYPAPVVGYQEVSIRFKSIFNLTQNTVGKSVSTFHTAKQYPTNVFHTPISNSARVKKNNLFTSEEVNIFGLSQGYCIETNDFHGKINTTEIIDGKGNSVQKSKYIYSKDNVVKTLDKDGQMAEEVIATEYDIYADTRFVKYEAKTSTIGGGVELTWTIPMPLKPMPIINISFAKSQTGFYTHTLNKHINQSAILERVETTYLGSTNMAKNLVRDRYSGEVIVSSLMDEFNDELYSISYPSHWYYPNLQNRYINENLHLLNVNINNGVLDFGTNNVADLVPGDVLEIDNGSATEMVWALTGGDGGALILANGAKANSSSQNYDVRILASARQNRITETMQQVTTKKNPIVGSNFVFPNDDVLSVSAVEYDYNYNLSCYISLGDGPSWKERTPYQVDLNQSLTFNPFVRGIMTNLYVNKQLALQQEREEPTAGIRVDSKIEDFVPFYKLGSNKWHRIHETSHPDNIADGDYGDWRELQKLEQFDEFGKPSMAKDPLNIHASVLYGFSPKSKLIPIAQAVNARSNQLAYTGFEDYDYLPNSLLVSSYPHFDFIQFGEPGVSITNEEKHSGKHSMKIEPESNAYSRNLFINSYLELCADSMPERVSEGQFTFPTCDCILGFFPFPGKYVVSAWVKQNNGAFNYDDLELKIDILNPSLVQQYAFEPKGPIIDGWQRIEGIFVVPTTTSTGAMDIRIVNNNTSFDAYVDDFRIHPFNSEMTTTVYNPDNLLPMATHDGRNYTTFYNYDENNRLVRIRVETIEGIKTISETTTGIRKRYTSN